MKDLYKKNNKPIPLFKQPEMPQVDLPIPEIEPPKKKSLMDIYKVDENATKHVVPEEQAFFGYLLKRGDQLAETYHGRITSRIDYGKYEAEVKMTFPQNTAFRKEDARLLEKIVKQTQNFGWEKEEDGSMRLDFFIDCFAPDETFASALAKQTRRVMERKSMTLEEYAAETGISVEHLQIILGE